MDEISVGSGVLGRQERDALLKWVALEQGSQSWGMPSLWLRAWREASQWAWLGGVCAALLPTYLAAFWAVASRDERRIAKAMGRWEDWRARLRTEGPRAHQFEGARVAVYGRLCGVLAILWAREQLEAARKAGLADLSALEASVEMLAVFFGEPLQAPGRWLSAREKVDLEILGLALTGKRFGMRDSYKPEGRGFRAMPSVGMLFAACAAHGTPSRWTRAGSSAERSEIEAAAGVSKPSRRAVARL